MYVPARQGAGVGALVGLAVGALVGDEVGAFVGLTVGDEVGAFVGVAVGEWVGALVGVLVGDEVGTAVGDGVGMTTHSVLRSSPSVHSPVAQPWHRWYPFLSWYLPDGQPKQLVWPVQAW